MRLTGLSSRSFFFVVWLLCLQVGLWLGRVSAFPSKWASKLKSYKQEPAHYYKS